MNLKRFSLSVLSLLLLALAVLALSACDSNTPTPTPVGATALPQGASPTSSATPMPTETTTPTQTATPTDTPTVTPTPTETPQPTVLSVPGKPPTMVVKQGLAGAQDQYNQAVAKWRSQNVVEYTMVVNNSSAAPFAGSWTLHVQGDRIDVLGYIPDGEKAPATPPVGMGGSALNFLTVDGQFASIASRLAGGSFGGVLEARADFVVSFDPVLGYPVSVETKIKPGYNLNMGSSTTISQLTILKRWPFPAEPQPAASPAAPTATTTGVAPPPTPPVASTAAPRAVVTPAPPPPSTPTATRAARQP